MNLSEFMTCLSVKQDLLDIGPEINPRLELAALTDWVCKHGGPALRFKQLADSKIEVVTNLFGSESRMSAVLGHESLAAFGARFKLELAQCQPENSIQGLNRFLTGSDIHLVSSPLSQRTDLSFLPQFLFWAEEKRTFLTLAVVITQDPDTTQQNYGIYRIGIVGKNRLTLNFLPHSGGANNLRKWQKRQQKMPVAILLGADPSLIFAAAASLPPACDEAVFSSWIQSKLHDFMNCRSVPLRSPVSTQVLLEGWLDPAETRNEGPFGCFTGSYGGGNDCSLLEVTSIASAEQPLIPQTLAGPLPMEDSWLFRANLEIMNARLSIDLPEISALEVPLDAAFHGLYFVRLKGARFQAAEIAIQLRKLDYFKQLKMLVVLDKGETVDELKWRSQVRQKLLSRVWKESSVQLDALLKNQPPKLHHEPVLLESVLNRLKQAGLNLEELCGGRRVHEEQ